MLLLQKRFFPVFSGYSFFFQFFKTGLTEVTCENDYVQGVMEIRSYSADDVGVAKAGQVQ